MIKVVTVLGTRPEIIRLSKIIPILDKEYDHTVIYTNQNYSPDLKQFLEEFKIKFIDVPNPSKLYGVEFMSHILIKLNNLFDSIEPDALLVLGDTHSVLSSVIIAKGKGIKIFHLEAGNRCFDSERVPEEVNRLMIDSISDWHLCYTQRARENLLREGKKPDKVVVVGNPIGEIIKPLNNLKQKDYILSTIHRKENLMDIDLRLIPLLDTLNSFGHVKLSFHPTLKDVMEKNMIYPSSYPNIEFFPPEGFDKFIKMEKECKCVISDSGTIPEEMMILNKPCVLLRYSTERPELLETNAMVVCSNIVNLRQAVNIAINLNKSTKKLEEYNKPTSSIVAKLLIRC